jgi:putative ABC transport system substrate-binding protein
VVQSAGDLVGAGLVASLAKPGGNITGSTDISPDLSGKRLEFLREVVPQVVCVAVLLYPTPGDQEELRATEAAAVQWGVHVQPMEVRDPQEFQRAYAAMAQQHAQAVILVTLAINLKTAQALGITILPTLLFLADEVIR